MPAYFIVDNEATDPAGFEEYRKQVPGTVEQYGGKFLVRAARCRRWRVTGSPSASS